MKSTKLILSILFFALIVINQGCKNESRVLEDNNSDSQKNGDANEMIKDSLLNFSKNPGNIRLSSIGRTVNTNELKTDKQNNISYYAGIYGADTLDANANGIPDWEQIIVNYDYNKLNVYLRFYEKGKKQKEYIFSEPVIANGIFRGYITENNKSELTEGKFVYFPDESLPNGKLTGLVLNRSGRLMFFSSLYSNGIQDLF